MTTSLYRNVRLTPEAFALLSRPVVGQGGYQDRLRRLQKAMNIEPDASIMAVSPSRVRIPEGYDANGRAGRPDPIRQYQDPETGKWKNIPAPGSDPITTAILQGIANAEATIKRLRAMLPTEMAPASFVEVDEEEPAHVVHAETVDVGNLDALLRKARKVKAEKAALHAVGRKRKSPKLSDEERLRRSKRMKAVWRKVRKAGK